MSSAESLDGSTASMRRKTVIGRMTSRYVPRTYRSRRTSSAMPHIKFVILLCGAHIAKAVVGHGGHIIADLILRNAPTRSMAPLQVVRRTVVGGHRWVQGRTR